MQAVGLSDDDAGVQRLKLINQATFFRCVEEDNANTLQVILKNRKIDVNAYNDEVREKSYYIASQHFSPEFGVCLFCSLYAIVVVAVVVEKC